MDFEKNKAMGMLLTVLAIAALLVVVFNLVQLNQLKKPPITGNAIAGTNPIGNIGSNIQMKTASFDVLPRGIPNVYGSELGLSFDDISANNQQKSDLTINKLGILDRQIKLSGNDLDRYIKVGSQISCEYCCGVEAIIFGNGEPACGCAHSFAMRGLAKYLIKNHGNELSNDEILEELGKWKTLFFPSQMSQKAKVLREKSIELNYINLASNKYRRIESQSQTKQAKTQVDMTGWTEDEKMMYEHHGTIPARLQQKSQ